MSIRGKVWFPLSGNYKRFIVVFLIVITLLPSKCAMPGDVASAPVNESAAGTSQICLTHIVQDDPPVAERIGDLDDEGVGDANDLNIAEEAYVEGSPSTLVKLKISAAGDTTLGGDPRYSQQFLREFEKQNRDHGYFLREVKHIFTDDDLTIVNLEGTLTEATAHLSKTFVLRGPPHFSKILSSSGVDVVSLANNHTIDYHSRGYKDTVEALEDVGVDYFGNEFNTILTVNGIRVGLFGHMFWYDDQDNRNRIVDSIEDLQERGAQLIIAYYHWGVEGDNRPTQYQRSLGRFTIDKGADLVLGAHPHVIQGIEVYKGKNIVYSLANFCFGGNNNPEDHDTFIFQQTFSFDEGTLLDTNETNLIPARISSERGRNNYQPIIAHGETAERILKRLQDYSEALTR